MKNTLLLRFLAILVTLVIWYQQALFREQETMVSLPIKFSGLAENLTVAEQNKKKINFKLNGRGIDILWFRASRPYLSIGNLQAGKNVISPEVKQIVSPRKFSVRISLPDEKTSLVVITEKVARIRKKVDLVFASQEDAFQLEKKRYTLHPAEVELDGPESAVHEVRRITTKPIAFREIQNDSLLIALNNPAPNIKLKPESVTLHIEALEYVVKTIPYIPVETTKNILPSKVSVKLRGLKEVMNKLDINSIKASIDEIALTDTTQTVSVRINVPENIEILEQTPKIVRILKN